MKIVIQCAAKKHPDAGYMMAKDGKCIVFVADPENAPASDEFRFARPDDIAVGEKTWRELLLEYNQQPDNNPLHLFPAYQLYMNGTYGALVNAYGRGNIYILSAGWGLIGAEFLTPKYDITFSPSADLYKRRKKRDQYNDYCMLPKDCDEELVFFGGKGYLPLFCELSKDYRGKRIVFYNSNTEPKAEGCNLIRFETTTRTNWHYGCAKAFLKGDIKA
ncbi:MAG: hypothetical protein DIZ77_10170 [endosymbiont of Seepiophila jonesi]|uniref:Uncharacterized protein n=1 Tax=endosymbiont of Lamellibrachia luymesi TaxID=2200907 RepID=A0A370DXX6_9GAMM|nr:MAG: hypothetical protein DIZ79_07480 [endosymbiont of Lamellibrachia luymesi]RDH91762.1 MAG: hypothetical protein DIZ77_10170 [endosymbiont of Seepiophila jonesi]